MDLLPTSIEGAITLWGGVLVGVVGVVARAAKAWRAAQDRRVQSIPPSAPPADLVKRLDTLERDVAVARLRWREEELVRELGKLQQRVTELNADVEQLKGALVAERQRALRAERERDAAQRTAEALRRG
jgi:hypothetical protein